ncbi:hypothetical protein TNCV_804121 [Trichonephila clavipes]|nr:hypothetical protein TNCV_804121 [Trichonephila clavipes]
MSSRPVQHDSSQKDKVPFTIVQTFMMGDFTYAESAGMHFMYGRVNGVTTSTFAPVTRHDDDRRKAAHSPSLEERILNAVADKPESSTRADAHRVNRVQALNLAGYLLRQPVGGTAMRAEAGLHSSCAEQLRRDLNEVLLFYVLALRYQFNHDDALNIEKNDEHHLLLISQIDKSVHHFQQPIDLPKIFCAI